MNLKSLVTDAEALLKRGEKAGVHEVEALVAAVRNFISHPKVVEAVEAEVATEAKKVESELSGTPPAPPAAS